ncbi:pilus assembly protein TadG-related protein [Timonella sp. A28]|uniref:pilus assembly protein TadG-related protein n=1 Tax=Timonella sp. A28 TaxID=3442640 RepID=UPI003EC05DEA
MTHIHKRIRDALKNNEDGNILILGLGYVLVVLLLAFVIFHIGTIYSERKKLVHIADGAALALADAQVSAEYLDLVAGGEPTHKNTVSSDAHAAVNHYVSATAAHYGLSGIDVLSVRLAEGTAYVELGVRRTNSLSFSVGERSQVSYSLRVNGHARVVE